MDFRDMIISKSDKNVWASARVVVIARNWVSRLRGVILEGEEIEGSHSGQVRILRGVILAK